MTVMKNFPVGVEVSMVWPPRFRIWRAIPARSHVSTFTMQSDTLRNPRSSLVTITASASPLSMIFTSSRPGDGRRDVYHLTPQHRHGCSQARSPSLSRRPLSVAPAISGRSPRSALGLKLCQSPTAFIAAYLRMA